MNLELYVSIPLYLVLAIAIIFLSYKLGDYVDNLDKKTKISGALIGGILLAAVTSLPELFTSLSAVIFLGKTDMVIGNILGSNLFNFMVLGFSIVMFVRKFKSTKLEKSHIYSLLILMGMTLTCLYAFLAPDNIQPVLGPINLLSLVIAGLYTLNVFVQPKEGESDEDEKKSECNLTVKQILVRFTICAVLLVATSVLITYVTDAIALKADLSSNIAGSLFLAIATSLPEVVSTITLCKRGNFNAGYGNIIGSGIFNFLILSISEFCSWGNSVFDNPSPTFLKESFLMSIFIFVVCLCTILVTGLLFLFIKKQDSKKNKIIFNILAISLGLVIFSGYICFLVLNTINIPLPF